MSAGSGASPPRGVGAQNSCEVTACASGYTVCAQGCCPLKAATTGPVDTPGYCGEGTHRWGSMGRDTPTSATTTIRTVTSSTRAGMASNGSFRPSTPRVLWDGTRRWRSMGRGIPTSATTTARTRISSTRAGDGTQWLIQAIDTGGDVGGAHIAGARWAGISPHISYYDYTNGDLKYARWGWHPMAASDRRHPGFSGMVHIAGARWAGISPYQLLRPHEMGSQLRALGWDSMAHSGHRYRKGCGKVHIAGARWAGISPYQLLRLYER